MPIFMKYESIDGESEVRGRKGYLEITSFSWGLTRAATTARGGGRGDAEVMTQEVIIGRTLDSVSALLVQEAAFGGFDRNVDIEFTRTGPNNRPITYYKVTLQNAGLASYQVASGGDTPAETMSIRYTAVTVESHKTGDDLSSVPNTAGIDVAAGTQL